MNLLEFTDFQAAKRWKRFVYLTENQPDFEKGLHPFRLSITFDKMTVSAVVDVGGLFFRRVKITPQLAQSGGLIASRVFWAIFSKLCAKMAKSTYL